MTDTLERSADEVETEEKKRGRKRDFTTSTEYYDTLAEFITSHKDYVSAGLPAISPLQLKAALALRTDYTNLPEKKAAREQAKAAREAEKAQFVGMSDDQIKASKSANRAEKQAEKFRAKADEALARAAELKAAASGSGEDLAAVVESAQNGAAEEEAAPRRKGLRRG